MLRVACSRFCFTLSLQTTNPRALDVATEVLKACTPAVRDNIKTRGKEFQQKMLALCAKHPSILKTVTGNGLLQAVHIQPDVPMFGGNQNGTVSFLAQCRKGLSLFMYLHIVAVTIHFFCSGYRHYQCCPHRQVHQPLRAQFQGGRLARRCS